MDYCKVCRGGYARYAVCTECEKKGFKDCPSCNGKGQERKRGETFLVECYRCRGKGWILQQANEAKP
jgi:DnaJ-class molecular chaperone